MIIFDDVSESVKEELLNAEVLLDSRDVAKEFKRLKRPMGELSEYINNHYEKIGVTEKGLDVFIQK